MLEVNMIRGQITEKSEELTKDLKTHYFSHLIYLDRNSHLKKPTKKEIFS